ncbi:hypothetical protein A3C96_02305 [Candidatus Uhrbacteria bacterium RIFCSPHIGHO2_02_FULL_60_10]|uniref:Thymidylate synthase n=1 Tax=Candidatus Uhrbacteria bacterium RIFCSPHIGHO2_02_FULL_60_10 TaxID=1802392 RepID=A0A1F7U5K1_9BACT|nr:MAG: hypothetical protein A3C96_02305 [Candidatus Uhrbacteria bacterium RIFCSPHIGHO2_02_FULL_60_10]
MFSPSDRAKLEQYVTDCDGDIFAVKNLEGIVGAVYARYSRASTGFRETLLKEFVEAGQIDPAKAEALIERVLIAFGDDSVGELEGAHVSFEDISNLATKEIEDRRIGGSPIEKSTRYVLYDQPGPDGRFRYHRDPAVMASEHAAAYEQTMDFIFKTYAELVEPMREYYRGLKPPEAAEYDINGDGKKERLADCTTPTDEKAFRRTYEMDLRTKACDALRYLLPTATTTNVGTFGNGRFFQNVLSHCYTSDLPEARALAARLQIQLNKIIPRYVQRAKRQEYQVTVRAQARALAGELFRAVKPRPEKTVTLIDGGEEAIADRLAREGLTGSTVGAALRDEEDVLTLSCMLYPHLAHPLRQIQEVVRALPAEKRQAVVAAYVGDRQTRRDRPGRAFEAGYPYTFDCLTDFGTYKDLMRHRITTQLRQAFTPTHGFVVPPDLEAAGFAHRALACRDRAVALYERLKPEFPEQAAYATLHGSLVRWVMGMNDREAQHLIELRTGPQGHPSYRKVGQQMHEAIAARSPWRAEVIKFCDRNDYFWSRGDSEAAQRVKEKKLESLKA